MNYAGNRVYAYDRNNNWIQDLKNFRYDFPYLQLMCFEVSYLAMHLIPRLPLKWDSRTKSCFWPFVGIFLVLLSVAATLYGVFFGWNPCWWADETDFCNTPEAPTCMAMVFIGMFYDFV